VSLALRLGYALPQPDQVRGMRDSRHYLGLARSLLEEHRYHEEAWAGEERVLYAFPGPSSFYLPGYPAFLAAVRALAGESPRSVYAAQALMGALGVWLVWAAGRRLLGDTGGLLAAALLAFNPHQIHMGSLVLAEGISATLMAAMLHAAVRTDAALADRPWGAALAFGLVLGLSALVRSPLAFVGAALGLGLVVAHRREPRSWAALVLAGLVGLAVVSPWLIRNYRLWGEPVYTTKVGFQMYVGHNDYATGTFVADPVPRHAPEQYTELERDRLLLRETLEWIGAHRIRTLQLAGIKLAELWNPVPEKARGLQYAVGLGWSSLFLALAALGLALGTLRLRVLRWPYVMVASYMAILLPAFASTRYRLPLDPVLAVFAALPLLLALDFLRPTETETEAAKSDR
jgi:4-amino-4-deoxy-L-arabinose transferase-like glycosyltransferase